MKTNILSNSKTVIGQPDNKKPGLIDTVTKISPVFLWLALVLGITATNIIAASIYVEPKTDVPPTLPFPVPPETPVTPTQPPINVATIPMPITPDIKINPPKQNENPKNPVTPEPTTPVLPEFNGHRFLVLIADTVEFRNRESSILDQLVSFNKSVIAEKVNTSFILVDSQGGRTWDITKDRVPSKREVFSNEKTYESIHQVYQVREKTIIPNSPKVFSVILWGSDVNPDTLVGLNLGLAPTWPKLFVWYGHPDKSVKLEEHLGSVNFISIKKDLSPLSNSLQFYSKKLERE
jgi:hypothetical protein